MAALEKISTLNDMKVLMNELLRLEVKFLFDFYGALQDFSSKKFLPQWLQKKSINTVFISEKGNEILKKISNSKRRSVVFYDLETPDLNGLQFLSTLENKPELKSRCKIILSTPQLTPEVRSKFMHSGVSALISKPLDEVSLQAAFEKIGFSC
jgi:chemotaxis family two-component system sensor histidine kinase/response regulator PixL